MNTLRRSLLKTERDCLLHVIAIIVRKDVRGIWNLHRLVFSLILFKLEYSFYIVEYETKWKRRRNNNVTA